MSFRLSDWARGCVRADIGSRSCRALFFEGEMADLFANPDVWHPIRSGFVGAGLGGIGLLAGDQPVGRQLNRVRAQLGLTPIRRLFQWWFSLELDWMKNPRTTL